MAEAARTNAPFTRQNLSAKPPKRKPFEVSEEDLDGTKPLRMMPPQPKRRTERCPQYQFHFMRQNAAWSLTQGGKGGTGKTTLLTALVDWYDEHQFPYTLDGSGYGGQ